jgi:translocation and assembly module TamA
MGRHLSHRPGGAGQDRSVDYRITGPGSGQSGLPEDLPDAAGGRAAACRLRQGQGTYHRHRLGAGLPGRRAGAASGPDRPGGLRRHVEFHLDTGPRWYLGQVSFKQDLLADELPWRSSSTSSPATSMTRTAAGLQGRLIGMEYYSDVEIVPLKDEAPARIESGADRGDRRAQQGQQVSGRRRLRDRRRAALQPGLPAPLHRPLRPQAQGRGGGLAGAAVAGAAEYRIPVRNPLSDYMMIRPSSTAYDTASRQGTCSSSASCTRC